MTDELHKPYLDVPPIGHLWFCKDYKEIWKEFNPVGERQPVIIKHRKDPKWFVVHEDIEGDYVMSFPTKKEALEDMHGCTNCYLIKGAVVKGHF